MELLPLSVADTVLPKIFAYASADMHECEWCKRVNVGACMIPVIGMVCRQWRTYCVQFGPVSTVTACVGAAALGYNRLMRCQREVNSYAMGVGISGNRTLARRIADLEATDDSDSADYAAARKFLVISATVHGHTSALNEIRAAVAEHSDAATLAAIRYDRICVLELILECVPDRDRWLQYHATHSVRSRASVDFFAQCGVTYRKRHSAELAELGLNEASARVAELC